MDKELFDMCMTDCKGKIVRAGKNGEIKLTVEAIIPVPIPFPDGNDLNFYLLAQPEDSNYHEVPFLVFEIQETDDPELDSILSPLVDKDRLSLVLAIYDAATELKSF